MGYRSDVSVVFYSRNMEDLPFSSLKLWFDETYPHREATTEWAAVIETGGDYVLVTYQYVKWYSDYKHVQAVRRALDLFDSTFDADDSEGLGSFELVEIGEETDDIKETRSSYNDYRLGVRRDITFD